MKDIRHSRLRCYVEEGHGGGQVESWPIYRFFKMYLRGQEDAAMSGFSAWYKEQYSRYRNVPKRLGGMAGGSLDSEVERRQGAVSRLNGGELDATRYGKCVDQAIETRVRQRFDLLNSIRNDGYCANEQDPVVGVEEQGCVYLVRGHHRVAVLRALGWDEYPDVRTFSNRFLFKTWTWWKRTRAAGARARGKVIGT